MFNSKLTVDVDSVTAVAQVGGYVVVEYTE